MIKQFILYILSIFTFSAFAQEQRHYISINPLGVSIPFGDFQSTSNLKLLSGGYAQPGWTGNIESGIFIRKNWGFVGQVGSMINQLDKAKKDASFESFNHGAGLYESSYGNYKSFHGLIGLIGSISLNKFSFDLKLTGGYLILFDPSIYFKYLNNYNQTYTTNGKPTASGAFVIMPGLNFRYSLTKRIGIRLNVDVMINNGVQVRKSIEYTETYPGASINYNGNVSVNPSYTTTYNLMYSTKITTINCGIGLFYIF